MCGVTKCIRALMAVALLSTACDCMPSIAHTQCLKSHTLAQKPAGRDDEKLLKALHCRIPTETKMCSQHSSPHSSPHSSASVHCIDQLHTRMYSTRPHNKRANLPAATSKTAWKPCHGGIKCRMPHEWPTLRMIGSTAAPLPHNELVSQGAAAALCTQLHLMYLECG